MEQTDARLGGRSTMKARHDTRQNGRLIHVGRHMAGRTIRRPLPGKMVPSRGPMQQKYRSGFRNGNARSRIWRAVACAPLASKRPNATCYRAGPISIGVAFTVGIGQPRCNLPVSATPCRGHALSLRRLIARCRTPATEAITTEVPFPYRNLLILRAHGQYPERATLLGRLDLADTLSVCGAWAARGLRGALHRYPKTRCARARCVSASYAPRTSPFPQLDIRA